MITTQANIISKTILEEEDLLTSEEAAAYLKISPTHFRASVSKKIPSTKSGKRLYFKKQELKSYFLSKKKEAKLKPEFQEAN